ncbi:hypothetical protein BROUX41_000392 [Berkeleyomyces rouxiae]|uniref:uncharacterized protein n=1 Tax=Berkeleyomyces rouxiae TaxID=2035830 RepID=UPI003B7F9B49
MKFAVAILSLVTVALAEVSAQDYFPSCSFQCLAEAVSTSSTCEFTDSVCMCTNSIDENLAVTATACLVKACGSDTTFNGVMPAADKFCRDALDGTTTSGSIAGLISSSESSVAATATGTTAASVTGSSDSTVTAGAAANFVPAAVAVFAAAVGMIAV